MVCTSGKVQEISIWHFLYILWVRTCGILEHISCTTGHIINSIHFLPTYTYISCIHTVQFKCTIVQCTICTYCIHCFLCSLILRGDPLSQRLLFRGPTESLQHAHIQLHTTQSQAITNNQVLLYTHTVWSVAALFFQVIQGCRAGFEPKKHPITLAQHHH